MEQHKIGKFLSVNVSICCNDHVTVVSTLAEPFAGWLDNMNGPYAIWVGALKGVLRFAYGDPDVALSFTPVDWAIRGMIVSAAASASKFVALS